MQKKKLGRTGMEVTQLGFGAMEIRGERTWGGRPVEDSEAEALLNAVLDAGINFIDTSPDYGRSESYIGRYISSRRNEYYLATKCGCTVVDKGDHDETPHVWTRDNLLRNIDESLRLMKTDHVDVWQLHNPTVELVTENNLVETMQEVRQSGRARFVGISTTLPHLPEFVRMGVFDTFQIPYSLLQRAEEESVTAAGEAGAGVIIRGGAARGILEKNRPRSPDPDLWESAALDELIGDMPRMEFVVRFTLTHPYCHTTIIGTLYPERVKENLGYAEKGPLPQNLYDEAKRRMTAAGEKPEPIHIA